MRAILIDPFTRTITDVEIDPTLDNLYQTLGVDLITVVRIEPGHALIIDDEGLLKDKDTQAYFWWKGSDQPFAGRGLILGDNYGENRDASLSLELVQSLVTFCDNANINPEEYLGWHIETF